MERNDAGSLEHAAAIRASAIASLAASGQMQSGLTGYDSYSSIVGLAGGLVPAPYRRFQLSSIAELNGELVTSPDLDTEMLLNRLFEVSQLSAGWDGSKAQPASHTALKNAAFAIIELYNRPCPDIALLDSGGILFEWNLHEITYQIEWFSEGGGEYSAFSKQAILLEGPMPESTRDVHWKLREITLTNDLLADPSPALRP